MCAQRVLLLGVGQAVKLVDEAPRQPRADVLAQHELGRRDTAAGDQRAGARRADLVLQHEELLLPHRVETIDVVRQIEPYGGVELHGSVRAVEPAAGVAGGDCLQQMRPAAAFTAPEIDKPLRTAGGERAQSGDHLGIAADDEVVERRAQRLDQVERQLLVGRIPIG